MGTTLITKKQRGANLNLLTVQQRNFVHELLATDMFCPTEAARKAGYKLPSQAANKLLKNRVISAALGKATREREERCELKGDDVLDYLHRALFFNPLNHFYHGHDGWMIDDPSVLPEWVGRLIEKMEVKHVVHPDGSVHDSFKVEFISKSTVLPLALKHLGLLTDKGEVTHRFEMDWDKLYGEEPEGETDEIEDQIKGNGRKK